MQGTIINHKGEAVKSAEISIRKVAPVTEAGVSHAEDGSEDQLQKNKLDEVIRVQTDQDGNFTLNHLDPDAKYIFEIRLKESNSDHQTDNLANAFIEFPIRSVDTKVTGFWDDDQEADDWNGREKTGWDDQEEDDWNDSEDGWNNRERDEWDDPRDEKDMRREEVWSSKHAKVEPLPEEPTVKTAVADNDDDYDDSEWFDIQEQEVMEQYAGNMIKQKENLEDKLITIRKYIW